jgi:hypothetical protein
MADLLAAARARIAALQREIAELQSFERTALHLASLAGEKPSMDSSEASASLTAPLGKAKLIEKIASEMLLKVDGGPLMTEHILPATKAAGVKFSSENEKNELSNYLSRSPLFENRRKEGGWFLK